MEYIFDQSVDQYTAYSFLHVLGADEDQNQFYYEYLALHQIIEETDIQYQQLQPHNAQVYHDLYILDEQDLYQ